MKKKIIYYKDELNDEFAEAKIKAIPINENYRYIRNSIFGKIMHFFWYRIIATPLAYFYLKIYFRHKTVGKEKMRNFEREGYFLYGNHTHFLADALIPTMISTPKDAYVIVNPDNVSMPILGKITPYLGALPLPDDAKAARNFKNALDVRVWEKRCIMIYPEAHIWPYYTDIRPFKDLSFKYPVMYDKPTFSLTNTYKKGKFLKRPQIVTYIDGPFFCDKDIEKSKRKKNLRDKVYNTMKNRAQLNDVEVIKYEKSKEV